MKLNNHIYCIRQIVSGHQDLYNLHDYILTHFLLEKFRETNIVVKIAPFNFLRALNFFKQSTVSCLRRGKSYCLWHLRSDGVLESHLWNTEATLSLWQIQGCFRASSARILLAGFTVSIWLIRFLAWKVRLKTKKADRFSVPHKFLIPLEVPTSSCHKQNLQMKRKIFCKILKSLCDELYNFKSCNYWMDVFLLLPVNGVKTLFGTLETLTGHWTRATWKEARGKNIFIRKFLFRGGVGGLTSGVTVSHSGVG